MESVVVKELRKYKEGKRGALVSICSSQEYVVRAAMRRAMRRKEPVLIEATSNQVNQDGGYSGMNPREFAAYVAGVARSVGISSDQVILGGDHLGPLPWRKLPVGEAMENARQLIKEFVSAGFTKIHVDTTMCLGGDPLDKALSMQVIAKRGVDLIKVAEEAVASSGSNSKPVYVIGSEVPFAGGMVQQHEIEITKKEDLEEMWGAFKSLLEQEGLGDVSKRVIAIVVETGANFGDTFVKNYVSESFGELKKYIAQEPSITFEGHSTDYQISPRLHEMSNDGIGILKVGPALTKAFTEAVFSFEQVETFACSRGHSDFSGVLDAEMLRDPSSWEEYYGTGEKSLMLRKFSFLDRSRYYLNSAPVRSSFSKLKENLDSCDIPVVLLRQFLPKQAKKVMNGLLKKTFDDILEDYIIEELDSYSFESSNSGAEEAGGVFRRKLSNGLEIPALGLGTFGSDRFSHEDIAKAVRGAINAGYRHIDCASVYGNEGEIGRELQDLMKEGLKREELWVTSKVWNDCHDNVIAACKQSIADLGVGYLDLYLVHWPFPNYHEPGCSVDSRSDNARPYIHAEFMKTWRQMEQLVEMGLVRAIGTSNMTIPKLKLLLRDAKVKPVVNEMELHPHFQQQQLFSFCIQNGIQPIGFCPIGSPTRPDRDRTTEDTVDIEDPVILRIAKNHGIHPAVVCIKWAVQRGQIPIPFSVNPNEYMQNLRSVMDDPLSENEMAEIATIDKNCRLIKGQVFLWREGQSWEDLWDLDGVIAS